MNLADIWPIARAIIRPLPPPHGIDRTCRHGIFTVGKCPQSGLEWNDSQFGAVSIKGTVASRYTSIPRTMTSMIETLSILYGKLGEAVEYMSKP